jgi:LAO/AO transport system kinase
MKKANWVLDDQETLSSEYKQLIEKAVQLEKWPLARLISLFENDSEQAHQTRHTIISHLENNPDLYTSKALTLGITGAPGAGKSSLIGELCLHFLSKPDISVAVLAVDPSSQISGGSILGDRTRVNFPRNEKRVFFRSQASNLDLGGISQKTYQATRLLRYFFDFIIIETVGIGQSEIEIQQVSDHTCLVMQPLAGDQVQFMKCGIMEIPETFIINKCDEENLARRSFHLLKSSLKTAHIHTEEEAEQKIFLTSAHTRRGIDQLAEFLQELANKKDHYSRRTLKEQEDFYLKKWISEEYGKFGVQVYEGDASFQGLSTYEKKELAFLKKIQTLIHT